MVIVTYHTAAHIDQFDKKYACAQLHAGACTCTCTCTRTHTHARTHMHMHMHAMMVCHVPRLAGGNNCRLWVTQPLMAGMIVSNEPGYYEDNAFGIRIENLLHIREADTPFKFGDQSYFGFERLTMIPLQRKMILTDVSPAKGFVYARNMFKAAAAVQSALAHRVTFCSAFCFAHLQACVLLSSHVSFSLSRMIALVGICVPRKTTGTVPVVGAVKEGD